MTAQSNRYAVRDKITLAAGEVTTLLILANQKRLRVELVQHASRHSKSGFHTWYRAVLRATGEHWPVSRVTYERLRLRIAGKRITKSEANANRLVIQFSREELELIRIRIVDWQNAPSEEQLWQKDSPTVETRQRVFHKITKQLNRITTK